MKKVIAFLTVLAVAASFAATAFAGTTETFENDGSAEFFSFSDYGENLTDITIANSSEQAHSGSSSAKILVKANSIGDHFCIMMLASEEGNPMAQITETDVANLFFYLPADGNIQEIKIYICDEENWAYCGVGSITPDNGTDTWLSLAEIAESFIKFDKDSRTSEEEGENTMPCSLMIECDLADNTKDAYFYMDDFYYGAEADYVADPAVEETGNTETGNTGTTATPKPTGTSTGTTKTGVVSAAVVAAVAVLGGAVVLKKKDF